MRSGCVRHAWMPRRCCERAQRGWSPSWPVHAFGRAFGLTLAIAAAGLIGAAGNRAAAQDMDCEAVRCAVQQAIDQNCRCGEAANHGRYVSCVARLVNRMARAGEIPRQCKGKIRRCAARSTCGKPGHVTCIRPIAACDAATGTCANDSAVTCTSDFDCGTRCSVKASAELCQALGGQVGASATCCSSCASGP